MQIHESTNPQSQTNNEQPVKRKRTRRGGRKNKKKKEAAQSETTPQMQQPGPVDIKPHTVQVQTPPQIKVDEPKPQVQQNEETIIRLR
jgi:hypothetical protein